MDADRELQLLLLALRERVVDPNRLAEAAGGWTHESGTGLMAFLVGRGVIAPNDLQRLEATTDRPVALRDGDPSLQSTTTDHPGRADTPAALGVGALHAPADVSDRYQIIRLHQTGGLGQVWLARDKAVGRDVALKTIRPERAAGQGARTRFVREARLTGQLEHPSIVPLYDIADGGAAPFYVMRFISGRTLAESSADYHRRRAEGRVGALDLNTLLDAFVNVCRAVAFAHSRNVLHRDLKGQNVAVGEYGEVFLLDWGLAKSIGEAETPTPSAADEGEGEVTAPGAAVGTPTYMAPEVAAGGLATKASDVYGLGAILYALLAGRAPYCGGTADVIRQVTTTDPAPVEAANPKAPRPLVAVARKAMARNPADRYSSADELATEVRRWLADEPVQAYREPLAARAARWARRRKTAVVAAAVLLLTTAVASSAAAGLVWREQLETKKAWQQADAEKVKATENAETAIEVLRDMSAYAQAYEMGQGIVGPTEHEREERLEKALRSYERLLALQPDEPFVRWNVARMHRFRANLGRFLNSTDEAERSYRKALELFSRLAAEFPKKLEYRELRALTLRDYGLFLHRLGRHSESRPIEDDSERFYEELHRAQPNEPNYQRLLGYMMIVRSDREYQLGRMAASERAARRAIELYEKVARTPNARSEPLDPLFHAMAEHNLALALEGTDAKTAIKYHDLAVRRLSAFVSATGSRDGSSFYHKVVAEFQWFMGQNPQRVGFSISNTQRSIDGLDNLIKMFGENPIDLKRKAVACLYMARYKLSTGKRDEAVKNLDTAARILERLVASEPRINEYRFELGRVYTTQGQCAATPQEAAERYGKAREMLETAIKQYPENVHYKKALADLDAAAGAKL
jgi:tetratricopeptide (TPR) repeat protein/tRNA A-37 threonylcarbamoyl transferase component Bud32